MRFIHYAAALVISLVVSFQASAQARYPSYEALRDAAIKARIERVQRSVPNTGRFTLDSAAHEDEEKYINMKSGVTLPEVIMNHVDDVLYDMDPEHAFERFFKCFYDGGLLPFIIDTIGTPCVCVTIGFKGVETSLQRTYRWPVQKVETGIRIPYLGRYHTEEETALQVAAAAAIFDSGGWVETRLSTANSRLQAALVNPAIAALITGGSSTPLAIPTIAMDRQAFEAANRMRKLPDCDDAKKTIAEGMAITDWENHKPCRSQGHTAFEGTERANEYHLMPDYLMREIAAHDGGINVPGFGPLTCHHKLDSSRKWYSEFPLPDPRPYLYAREPSITYSAPAPYNRMMNIMTADPFRCLGRNLDEGTGLSPNEPPISNMATPRDAVAAEPCMPFNHGSIVPFTATAQTRYDPVASAVGFYKSIKIARATDEHSRGPRAFHDFDPEKDRVLWRGHQQKEECMQLFQNYLPEAGTGKYPAYDEMMEDALNQTGNVGMHWRQFTCCHSEHPDIMFPPQNCESMNFE